MQRQKAYGNKNQADYIDWLVQFARQVHRVLKDDGSFVLDLGGAYECQRRREIAPRRSFLRCTSRGF